MVTVVCLLATVLITTCLATMLPVDYTKQNEWVGVCNVEGAVKQSPIDVITPGTCTKLGDTVIEFPEKAKSVPIKNKNDVNLIKFSIDDDVAETMAYNIPGKESTQAKVKNIHLHWGATDSEGSEHQLDGVQHVAESHAVTQYGEVYAVLARFFKVGAANVEIQRLIDAVKAPKDSEDRNIADFNLAALYPNDIKAVLTYDGSLTTPDCTEVVYWVVVPELLTISTDQLAELRTLKLGDDPATGTAKTRNWRREQLLNGRVVTCYSAAPSLALSPLLISTLIFISQFI